MKSTSLLFIFGLSLNFSSSEFNKFQFGEVDYTTSHGYYESYGSDDSGASVNYDIHLMSVAKESMHERFDYVLLDLNSDDSGEVAIGNYSYSDTENKNIESFTFNSASVLINYDANSYSGDVYFAIDGKLEIGKNGEKYTLEYELLLENGKVVTGFYEGNLMPWDQGI
ncbi:MAG: hypothetical protein AAGF85_14030 [Bacteroidota bacterium]